jgi:hypothetical protein
MTMWVNSTTRMPANGRAGAALSASAGAAAVAIGEAPGEVVIRGLQMGKRWDAGFQYLHFCHE